MYNPGKVTTSKHIIYEEYSFEEMVQIKTKNHEQMLGIAEEEHAKRQLGDPRKSTMSDRGCCMWL